MASSLEILQGFTGGQIAAILNKISSGDPEKLEALLRDEFEVHLVERILKLADKNGRIIPRGIKNSVCDADKEFYLVQPSLKTGDDYAARFARFLEAFRVGPMMLTAEFEGKSKELIAEIKNNKNLANLLSGVYLPLILSRLGVVDYGKALEEVFLPAVASSYEKQFSKRKFYNYRKGDLAGKVAIVPGTKHEKLIKRMAQAFVVAIYFPNSLQGFSILASREQISALPESLILSGGFDSLSAMVMYPDILVKDWYTPGYDLSALSWRSPDYSLCLEAGVGGLVFDGRGVLGGAGGVRFSSGLLFLGSA